MKSADADVDRMHLAAADRPDQRVAGLLDPEAALDHLAMFARHRHRVGALQEVRRVQQEHVQRLAFDPLAAIDQAAQIGERTRDRDTGRILHRRATAHLVRDRADAADARGDVGRLEVRAPAQERLEESRRLENPQLHVAHAFALEADAQRALTLDAREIINLDRLHGRSMRPRTARPPR
jgi:hypothetical protein